MQHARWNMVASCQGCTARYFWCEMQLVCFFLVLDRLLFSVQDATSLLLVSAGLAVSVQCKMELLCFLSTLDSSESTIGYYFHLPLHGR